VVVGLLHPGEMGSAVAGQLQAPVVWASEGRSEETAKRAAAFDDVGTTAEVARRADVVLSICPPHAAREVAGSVAGFEGIYVDANAVSPETARAVGESFERFVDGGIVGGPSAPNLYLSGPDAGEVAALFEGSAVDARVLGTEIGAASALKCAYAGWSKGTAALLLALEELAEREGVADALHAEWAGSVPELADRLERAQRSAGRKGWRWVGEMEEIAKALEANGLPGGFHHAAAEVFGWRQGVRS
jgi:3-hydroxyisobutyrate dehydrogenase-like beta-hydroxyacid dehydrogenase